MQRIKIIIAALFTVVILSGCSGGSSSGGSGSISGGDPTSPSSNPKVMQAISAIQTNPELWSMVRGHRITMRRNLEVAGVGRAACAAHKSVGIVLNTDYINQKPMRTAVACILHEALHLNEGHSGQTPQQELAATEFAKRGLVILGM